MHPLPSPRWRSGAWKGSRSSHSLLWETREVTELAASGCQCPMVGPLWPDSKAEGQIPLPGAGERALLDLVQSAVPAGARWGESE